MPSILSALLESGSLQPSKVLLLDEKHGDMKARVEKGLELQRKGEVRGEKIVVKIDH